MSEKMEKQDQPIKFFQESSITDKYEEKYELYTKLINSYTGGKLKAKYRELDEIIAEQKKQLETVRTILASDNLPSNMDAKSIMATLEAAIDSKISVMDMIKVQQKDQDAMIKLHLAQDDTLSKWMDARKIELNQISVDKVLTTLHQQLEWIEEQTGIMGLASTFRVNARKEITKATNCGVGIFDGSETVGGQKAFFTEAHEIHKEYGIHFRTATKLLSQLKKDPTLNKEELIQNYLNNEEDKASVAI